MILSIALDDARIGMVQVTPLQMCMVYCMECIRLTTWVDEADDGPLLLSFGWLIRRTQDRIILDCGSNYARIKLVLYDMLDVACP